MQPALRGESGTRGGTVDVDAQGRDRPRTRAGDHHGGRTGVRQQPSGGAPPEVVGGGDEDGRARVDVRVLQLAGRADHLDVHALVGEHPGHGPGARCRPGCRGRARRRCGCSVPSSTATSRAASVPATDQHAWSGAAPTSPSCGARQLVVEREHGPRLLRGGLAVAVQHEVEEPRPLVDALRAVGVPSARSATASSWAVAPGASSSRPRSTWRTASARKPSTSAVPWSRRRTPPRPAPATRRRPRTRRGPPRPCCCAVRAVRVRVTSHARASTSSSPTSIAKNVDSGGADEAASSVAGDRAPHPVEQPAEDVVLPVVGLAAARGAAASAPRPAMGTRGGSAGTSRITRR